jgi:predicted metal-dependent hydrolase
LKRQDAGGRGFQLVRQDLPEILSAHTRKFDLDELLESCQKPLSSLALQGLDLFNKGDYFEAHERLEAAWNEELSPGRELYRAVLQVAVAYLQIQRQNYTGALKMFLRLRQWIEPLPDECRGVDVDTLRKDAQGVYEQLISAGKDKLADFDQSLFKPVIYKTKIKRSAISTIRRFSSRIR